MAASLGGKSAAKRSASKSHRTSQQPATTFEECNAIETFRVARLHLSRRVRYDADTAIALAMEQRSTIEVSTLKGSMQLKR